MQTSVSWTQHSIKQHPNMSSRGRQPPAGHAADPPGVPNRLLAPLFAIVEGEALHDPRALSLLSQCCQELGACILAETGPGVYVPGASRTAGSASARGDQAREAGQNSPAASMAVPSVMVLRHVVEAWCFYGEACGAACYRQLAKARRSPELEMFFALPKAAAGGSASGPPRAVGLERAAHAAASAATFERLTRNLGTAERDGLLRRGLAAGKYGPALARELMRAQFAAEKKEGKRQPVHLPGGAAEERARFSCLYAVPAALSGRLDVLGLFRLEDWDDDPEVLPEVLCAGPSRVFRALMEKHGEGFWKKALAAVFAPDDGDEEQGMLEAGGPYDPLVNLAGVVGSGEAAAWLVVQVAGHPRLSSGRKAEFWAQLYLRRLAPAQSGSDFLAEQEEGAGVRYGPPLPGLVAALSKRVPGGILRQHVPGPDVFSNNLVGLSKLFVGYAGRCLTADDAGWYEGFARYLDAYNAALAQNPPTVRRSLFAARVVGAAALMRSAAGAGLENFGPKDEARAVRRAGLIAGLLEQKGLLLPPAAAMGAEEYGKILGRAGVDAPTVYVALWPWLPLEAFRFAGAEDVLLATALWGGRWSRLAGADRRVLFARFALFLPHFQLDAVPLLEKYLRLFLSWIPGVYRLIVRPQPWDAPPEGSGRGLRRRCVLAPLPEPDDVSPEQLGQSLSDEALAFISRGAPRDLFEHALGGLPVVSSAVFGLFVDISAGHFGGSPPFLAQRELGGENAVSPRTHEVSGAASVAEKLVAVLCQPVRELDAAKFFEHYVTYSLVSHERSTRQKHARALARALGDELGAFLGRKEARTALRFAPTVAFLDWMHGKFPRVAAAHAGPLSAALFAATGLRILPRPGR